MSKQQMLYEKYVKRVLDIVCSLAFFAIFWWVYLVIAFLVRVRLGKPVLFRQKRPGKIDWKTGKERIFYLYKFRTMTNEHDKDGELLPDASRLTGFGRALRSSSLDELPELINILRGDMSFVGPRPLTVSYLNYYTKTEHHRHDVRPGLTGLAQINGRNAISWDQKFQYDLEYVKKCSFMLDLKIILTTVIRVINRENIGQGEEAPKNLYDVRNDWVDETGEIKPEYDETDRFFGNKPSNTKSFR